jgi:lipid A disaccharide synthetase
VRCAAAGADIVVDADRLSVVGITEVIRQGPATVQGHGPQLKRQLAATPPDL